MDQLRRCRFVALRSLLSTAVLLLLAASAIAAEKIGIETGRHEGFGRVVFAWPSTVKFEARLDEKKGIVIEFERPFVADLEAIAKQLPL